MTHRYWAIVAVAINPESWIPPYSLLLGRPTDVSVTVNAILDQDGEVYFEYGTASGSYTSGQTGVLSATAGEPVEAVINSLGSNTLYFYRMLYRATSAAEWNEGEEYSFHTQRTQGETFTFTITSDSHLDMLGDSERWERTTLNVASDNQDFHIDLGDTFITNDVEDQADADEVYLTQRDYFGNFSHSAPVFNVLGNHENEKGWNFDNSPSKGLLSINARKKFFLNPVTDGFYSGNTDNSETRIVGDTTDDHLREDYYAWTWGDALFIVLDPFQYTMTKPYAEDLFNEDPGSTETIGDQWDWTLGEEQFNWFKNTLENSNSKYIFVFSHHVTGGIPYERVAGVGPGYVRRGADAAPYFEWGGYNEDGSTWGFDTERPGWGVDAEHPNGTSIHQLMIDNHVSAFFHGHDHQYAYEIRDGIVYQALASSTSIADGGFNLYDEDDEYTERVIDNSGHLRVTVASSQTTVEYVRSDESNSSINGDVSHSYTIAPNEQVNDCQADIQPTEGDGDVDGSDLAAWIGGSGISLEVFAAEFGRIDCM